jgi:hypothetical protein
MTLRGIFIKILLAMTMSPIKKIVAAIETPIMTLVVSLFSRKMVMHLVRVSLFGIGNVSPFNDPQHASMQLFQMDYCIPSGLVQDRKVRFYIGGMMKN